MGKFDTEDKIEQVRKEWQNADFQEVHRLAREKVLRNLRELNGFYIVKTGHGFVRFVEERMKTPESICGKLERKGYDLDFETAVEELNDISGVRCICHSIKEIYWIARQIGKDDRFEVLKVKDYVRKPKKNGYESYHIIMNVPVKRGKKEEAVRVELQLRTLIMDAWASMDNRICYKKGQSVPPQVQRQIEKYAKIGRHLDKLIERGMEAASGQ